MAIINQNTGERFTEVVLVQSEASAVNVFSIPQNCVIQDVKAISEVAGVGAANFILGDDDDDNGYIVAKDATSAAGTVVGDDPTERGAYLYDATKKGSFSKTYTAAGKFLKLAMSTTQTTYIKLKVIITGFRY